MFMSVYFLVCLLVCLRHARIRISLGPDLGEYKSSSIFEQDGKKFTPVRPV